ncbi:nucleotidyltransferase-like protein [Paenibacillus sp. KN14-4R]|uniref:nucleotidyltransferase-like protein n=1 Tax=Paenibacillus sp. KN14-4R TaxID=3445773 RepID=UPI003F9FC305
MPKNFNNCYEKFIQDQSVLGVIRVPVEVEYPSSTNNIDLLLLILTCDTTKHNCTFYYIKGNIRIQERWIETAYMKQCTIGGKDPNLLRWVLRGEIVVERDAQLAGLRNNIVNFPVEMKDRLLLIEFAQFLRKYQESREYVLDEQVLDAYACILQALHHWARIAIIEAGFYPDNMIWQQIRTINPGIYKLFEELTMSNETLKQRVQLVLLACEFSVVSRISNCCTLLLRILDSRPEPWSLEELKICLEIEDIHLELPMLLNKLIRKSLIKEVLVTNTSDMSELTIMYTIESM